MADIDYSEIEQEAWRGWLEKSGMEKAISLGILGEPELRKDEKNRFLGEFEERVLLALTMAELGDQEALEKVEDALRDPRAKTIIIHSEVPFQLVSKYMKLARRYQHNCTVRHNPEFKGKVALVVISDQAVH
ncbi:MAG: YueI family protein [Bacillota bacterium]|jgi:uncharacterized protein YueI